MKATLGYNVKVLTKNPVTPEQKEEVTKQAKHKNNIMVKNDKRYAEPLKVETWSKVLKYLKKKNKNMFRHITKPGMDFQDNVFD